MKGHVADIEELTEANKDFHHVRCTGQNLQLALMSLKPGEDFGLDHAGSFHKLSNTGDKPMKVHTICYPPNHVDQLELRTKSVAQALSEHFDGKVRG